MPEVVFTSYAAYNRIGEAATFGVIKSVGSQHADAACFQLRQPYRSYATGDICFNDAERIGYVVERTDVHRDVRPSGSGKTCDKRRAARVSGAKQDVSAVKYRSQRSRIRTRQRDKRTGRLCQVERESTNDSCAKLLNDA
ncbi:MAG TPA: hypothetical protein VJ376_11190 [Pseudomonadota bacterium]|nr:hypothetical protein [Pseudomonadota bacterium]